MPTLAASRPIDHEALDLLAFLDGHVEGHGVVEDRFGRLRRRFHITMRGRLEGRRLELDERVLYDDGAEERRHWQLDRTGAGTFEGQADDCVGPIRGVSAGGTAILSYVFRLRLGARTISVSIEDRFYRINDRVVADRATIRKWGIKIAEISLVCEKKGEGIV